METKIEYNENKVLKHSNSNKLEYLGKCLLVTSGKTKILVVGDLHLGYEEALNRSGVFVSRQMFDEMISDFEKIFEYISKTEKRINVQSRKRGASELEEGNIGNKKSEKAIVDKIVLLGDIKHDFGGISRQEWGDVNKLIDYLKPMTKEIIAIKGNHDTILEPIVKRMGKNVKMKDYYLFRDFCFLHGNRDFEKIWDKKIKYIVMGHIHPAVKLREGIKVEKYKCFLSGKFKGKELIAVPSFIEYNIGTDPREGEEDFPAWPIKFDDFNVRVVGEGLETLDFGKLKKIKS